MAYTRPLPPVCRCCTNQTSIFRDCDNTKIGSYTLLTLERETQRRRRDSVVNRKTLLYRLSFSRQYNAVYGTNGVTDQETMGYTDEHTTQQWPRTQTHTHTHTSPTLWGSSFCKVPVRVKIPLTQVPSTTNLTHVFSTETEQRATQENISTDAQVAFHCLLLQGLNIWPLVLSDTVTFLVPDHLPFKKLQWDD